MQTTTPQVKEDNINPFMLSLNYADQFLSAQNEFSFNCMKYGRHLRSYRPLCVVALSCAPSWTRHRSTAHSSVRGFELAVGSGTRPWGAETHYTASHIQSPHLHTDTGICNWAESSGRCDRSHHCAHSQCLSNLDSEKEQNELSQVDHIQGGYNTKKSMWCFIWK